MLDLSPTKLLIIFVVVVVLLGPKRLPEVARQLGAGWRKLRDLHGRLDRELRQTMPDLPSSQDIVRFARSPITLLNQLADHPGESSPQDSAEAATPDAASDAGSNGAASNGAASNGAGPRRAGPRRVPVNGEGRAEWRGQRAQGERGMPVVAAPALAGLDTDDPNLN